MSLFKEMKSRQIQKKANSFIESLKKKSESQIEQAYLDNKEFENNEIVLSYLFFNHVQLIRILPLEFQKSRINSNLSMFNYGSDEAKRALVSDWLHENKFFMNALVVGFNEEEYQNYIKLYFKQCDDVALLYMDDLHRVIETLSEIDLKQTEEMISKIKDKLSTRQWEFIINVNPIFIKYADQETQNAHSNDEKYIRFLSGDAKKKYISDQVDKISKNISELDKMDIDIQVEYVKRHPYMLNYLSDEILTNVLKYDVELIKYVNLSLSKNKEDKTQEVICSILENLENKTNKDIVNILVNKCLLNAKGKLYRFDPKSNDISYQYTKRVIKSIQDLTMDQIITLIMIDANYILPYVVPVYTDSTPREEKEKITIDCNSRCLNVFKEYFGEELYDKYYKTINKIYSEYIENLDNYDFSKDYRCIFELLKVLFNKDIIKNNNPEKISVFIGTSLFYKNGDNENAKKTCIKLLNDILSCAYKVKVENNREIYNINSLEIFDPRLSFISRELLMDYSKYNFVNISNLLLIIKSDKIIDLFKKYYEIITYIYGENKETLYRAIENFSYYKNILKSVENEKLDDEELDNLVVLLSTFFNQYNINKKDELSNFEMTSLRKLITAIGEVTDENIAKNLLCNYLFNKGYDDKGISGWLEVDTIKQICDVYDIDCIKSLKIDGKKVFDEDEVNLFAMCKLLFSVNDFDLVLSFIEKIIEGKIKRNILSTSELFNKIKKYRVELINNEIVSIEEIESLYVERPDMVMKNSRNGVDVYTVVGQDFRILCSTNDDGINYACTNVVSLEKNVYGYNFMENDRSIRFADEDGKTIIKLNKDNYYDEGMKARFVVVVGALSNDLLTIAKENNLKIVEVQSE